MKQCPDYFIVIQGNKIPIVFGDDTNGRIDIDDNIYYPPRNLMYNISTEVPIKKRSKMNILRRFLCFLRGHTPKWYLKNGIYEARCSTCKKELNPRHDINPFGW